MARTFIDVDVTASHRGRPRQWLTALIKEARERARRRRLRIAAAGFVAAIAVLSVAFGGFFNNAGGGGTASAREPSVPVGATAASTAVVNGPLTLLANPSDDEQIAAVGVFGATGALFPLFSRQGLLRADRFCLVTEWAVARHRCGLGQHRRRLQRAPPAQPQDGP
jgi:hypothetical protein